MDFNITPYRAKKTACLPVEPKVTIITATRRRPDFLRRCILAVQRQELPDHEHIIVADHCAYSRAVYEQFNADPRIRFFEVSGGHIRNEGAVGKAIGIQQARSDYICYCDDDNILLPNHTRILYKELSTHPDHDAVFSRHYILPMENMNDYRDIIKRELFDYTGYRDIDFKDMLSCMHRKSTVETYGSWIPRCVLEEKTDVRPSHEDNFVMNLWHARKAKILFLTDVTALYFAHGGNWLPEEGNLRKAAYEDLLAAMSKDQVYAYPDLKKDTSSG